jgi:hypothetical protein
MVERDALPLIRLKKITRSLSEVREFRKELRDQLFGVIGRAVVDNNHLIIGERLVQNALEGFSEICRAIVSRNNDRQLWAIHFYSSWESMSETTITARRAIQNFTRVLANRSCDQRRCIRKKIEDEPVRVRARPYASNSAAQHRNLR